MKNRVRKAFALGAAVSLLVVAACGGDDDEAAADDSGGDSTISIVGFAVPEAANKAIADEWTKTPEGEGVEFKTSYGASGDQSRAVVSGLEADYVHFSVASDVTRLVDAGLVADNWDDGPTKGIVSSSVVVFAVREGNPKGIETWDDLIQPGVEIVTPNPASSGAARWNALAAWGQVIESGGTEAEAEAYLTKLLRQRRRPARQRPRRHHRVPRRHRRRADGLRERGDPRPPERRGVRLHHPRDHDAHREPGRGAHRRRPQGQGVARLRAQRRTASSQFALKGFRPIIDGVEFGEVEGANDPSDPFPEVTNLLTVDDDFGSWATLSDEVLRRGDGHRDPDHRRLRARPSDHDHRHGSERPARVAPAGPRAGRRSTRASGLGLGVAMLWFSLLVLIPLAAVVVTATEGGWSALLATRSPTSRRRPPSASPSARRCSSPRSTS